MRQPMKLAERLAARKSAIVKEWFDLVVATYPPDTSRFLKAQKDPFANPVGNSTLRGLQTAFDGLLRDADADARQQALDAIVRIRAVQDFTPAQATGFVLELKPILRRVLRKELAQPEAWTELLEIERRVDILLLTAFDIYLRCRETLFQLKVDMEKNRIHHAFTRAGLVTETPDAKPPPETS